MSAMTYKSFVALVALLGLVQGLHWQREQLVDVVPLQVDQDDLEALEDMDKMMEKYFTEAEEAKEYLRETEETMEEALAPPPHEKTARMARYIMHNSEWGALATLSTQPALKSFPFANVFSVSDGPDLRLATGIPYFYFTPLDMSVKDLYLDNRASLSLSLASGEYCSNHHYDPEDPRCAHLILTGTVDRVEYDSHEESFARNALFTRHPEMAEWPADHSWFFGKLNVSSVIVLDYFGGASHVSIDDYFSALPTFNEI